MQESSFVCAPTRELVIQIGKNIKAVSMALRRMPDFDTTEKVNVITIYGGQDKAQQENELKSASQNSILVSTTGRLLDILEGSKDKKNEASNSNDDKREAIASFLGRLSFWVIDEADRMATHSDLSQQIDAILPTISKDATRVFASATWPRDSTKWEMWMWGSPLSDADAHSKPCTIIRVNPNAIKSAAKKKPEVVDKDEKSDNAAEKVLKGEVMWSDIPPNITQTLHVCSDHKKPRKLITTLQKLNKDIANSRHRPLCIVFFGTIKTLQYWKKLLSKEGISCEELHSHMPQHVRERNIQTFSSGKAPLLLATDICARGVHVNHVRAVIQYDFPGNMEQYIHRCGVSSFFKYNLCCTILK